MKKQVVSIDAYHEEHVSNAIEELQDAGYEVQFTERISRIKFGIFGKDVTQIQYKELAPLGK